MAPISLDAMEDVHVHDKEKVVPPGRIRFIASRIQFIASRIIFARIKIYKLKCNILFILLSVVLVLGIIYSVNNNNEQEEDFSHIKLTAHDSEEYGEKSMVSRTFLSSDIDSPFYVGCTVPDTSQRRANASLVVLARNSEVLDVVKSMKSMERHFNQWYNYPWVFLNDEPFDDTFKETVKKYTTSEIEFGTIAASEWNFKEEDADLIAESIANQGDRQILYGNLESYHKMCRFYSMSFYKHELVKKREWYWRVEPNVEFYCDLTYDPFVEMEKRGKKYGFTVMIGELYYTVPGLFRETRAFLKKSKLKVGNAWNLFVDTSKYTSSKGKKYNGSNKREILQEIEDELTLKRFLQMRKKKDSNVEEFDRDLIKKLFQDSMKLPLLSEDRMDQEEYNLCHFWSNFEIAKTEIFTSPEYQAYFEHLDASGGFFRERWGDAPVHLLAVGMLLNLEDIHYFRDIGYKHSVLAHCPANAPPQQLPYEESDRYIFSGKNRKEPKPDKPRARGVGCRCKCPPKHREIEDSGSSCIRDWAKITANNFRKPEIVDVDFWEKRIEDLLDDFLATGGELGTNELARSMFDN